MPKATEKDIETHKLILSKNDLALAKLFDTYGKSIIDSLKQWYPKVADEDYNLIIAAVNEAFFGYFQNPNTFNPKLNELKRFLEIASERDLINALKREKRHHLNRENLPEDVELEEKIWNRSLEEKENPESEIIRNEISEKIDSLLKEYFPNGKDMDLAKLILGKERKTEVFVEVFGLTNLNKEEQELLVKRNKDRIKKVIERNGLENKIKILLS